MKIVIPTHEKDIHKLSPCLESLLKNMRIIGGGSRKIEKISYENIVVIANNKIRDIVESINNRIIFIDEDNLINGLDTTKIKNCIDNKGINYAWYFQQFLKMAYAFICKEEFYLVWDSDSLLIRELLIDLQNPFLNALPHSIDSNHPYINTMHELLNITRKCKYQFMCEFMLFKKSIMLDLISKLGGKEFYIPILNKAISNPNKYSFSEFETYARFSLSTNIYELKYYPVYRCGGRFFDSIPRLDNELIKKFSKTYYTIQFNHWDRKVKFAKILENKILMSIFGFKNIMRIYYYFGFYKRDTKYLKTTKFKD